MDQLSTARADREPVGIVIAGPSRTEIVPRVLAYVWGPAPELMLDTNDFTTNTVGARDVIATPRAA